MSVLSWTSIYFNSVNVCCIRNSRKHSQKKILFTNARLFLSLILSLDLIVSVRDVFMSNLGKKSTLSRKILASEHCECSAQTSRVSFKFFLSQLFYESELKKNWSLFQFANTEKQIIAPCKSTVEEVLFESSHHKILSTDLACVASVFGVFRSKERPRNGICLSLTARKRLLRRLPQTRKLEPRTF